MFVRTFTLTIDRLSYGPAGVGRVHGKALFVPGTVPGDEVEVALVEEKKNYAVGNLIAIRHPSSQRRFPPCPYITRCGGCPWQQVSYTEQLKAKEAAVREHLRRIGGIVDPPVLPIIRSPQEWHYRHRIRLRAKGAHHLGFSRAHSHDVVEVESCLIADGQVSAQVADARAWFTSLLTRVHWVELVRGEHSHEQEARGVVLVGKASGAFHPRDEEACQRFLQLHTNVSGVMLFGRGWRRSWGNCQVCLDLGVDDLTLCVSPGIFTQVNPAGNRALLAALLRLSEPQKEQEVIELYCGAGNLSVPLARRVRKLIGIEQDDSAVRDARANAVRAGLRNVQFLCTPVRAGIRDLLRAGTRCDVVVLDPPRAGAAEIIEAIPRLQARKVVYVSCDPATLARDLRRLSTQGYGVRALQPVDLFPQTYHVETIAILTC